MLSLILAYANDMVSVSFVPPPSVSKVQRKMRTGNEQYKSAVSRWLGTGIATKL